MLEEEVVLLQTDNEHLRQRVDQAQEANYLTETELHSEQNKILHLEATSVLAKYNNKYATKSELKSLRDDLYAIKSIALRLQSAVDNWVAFMQGVEVGD